MIGDQQSAALRPGVYRARNGQEHIRHRLLLLLNTGDKPVESSNKLLSTIAWSLEGGQCVYALEGSVFMGATIQWLRDGLGIIDSAADVNELASKVDDTGGVVLVPAFAGLGTVLGCSCKRINSWDDPRDEQIACGIGRVAGNRLQCDRSTPRHGIRFWYFTQAGQGGWWCRCE